MNNYDSNDNQRRSPIWLPYSIILSFGIGVAIGAVLPKEKIIEQPAFIDLASGTELNSNHINPINKIK